MVHKVKGKEIFRNKLEYLSIQEDMVCESGREKKDIVI